MRLTDVALRVQGQLQNGDCEIIAVSTDSRRTMPGDVFVALVGDNFDGHNFLDAAVQAGAAGVVVQHANVHISQPQLIVPDTLKALGTIGAMRRESFTGTVVAVTGSCGKTSVKGMLASIFSRCGSAVATYGNYNNQIGVPLTLMQLSSQDYAVIEVGTSFPGEIGYLTGLVTPHVSLVNNIAPAHVGGFSGLEAIADEKSEIYSLLDADQTAVINLDDDFAPRFINQTRHCRQLGFTRKSGMVEPLARMVEAHEERLDQRGRPVFRLETSVGSCDVQLQVAGQFNIANALAAAACALASDVSLDDIVAGLADYAGEKGRMQFYRTVAGSTIIDDTYNANPVAVKAAIDLLETFAGSRYLVLGDMAELGDCARLAHEEIGEYAASKKVTAVYSWGGDAALAARAFGKSGYAYNSKSDLVAALLPQLKSNATVLVKGSRSARMEEVVKQLCGTGASLC